MMKDLLLIFYTLMLINGSSACTTFDRATKNKESKTTNNGRSFQAANQRNIREWLDIVPDRYLTFSCEGKERRNVLENLDVVDIENDYLCSGQPDGREPIPGEVCFSLKAFPYRNGKELLVIINEKFDPVCTYIDHFFLVFSEGKWEEIHASQLFEIDIMDYRFYYPENEVPTLYQNEILFKSEFGISADY
ncbi:MAG: hypothetical protein AAF551_11450, partial [Bacteroidota bacterium]